MANVESYARGFGLVIDHCQPIVGSEIAWTLIRGAASPRHSAKIENLCLFFCSGPLATKRMGLVEKLRNFVPVWQLKPARDHAPGLRISSLSAFFSAFCKTTIDGLLRSRLVMKNTGCRRATSRSIENYSAITNDMS